MCFPYWQDSSYYIASHTNIKLFYWTFKDEKPLGYHSHQILSIVPHTSSYFASLYILVHSVSQWIFSILTPGSWGEESAPCCLATQEGVPWPADWPPLLPERCQAAGHHQQLPRGLPLFVRLWHHHWTSWCSGKIFFLLRTFSISSIECLDNFVSWVIPFYVLSIFICCILCDL